MSLVEADSECFLVDDAACCAMVSDLLKDSEEQTDVPAEPERPASHNESEEERRSPEAQRWSPGSSSFSDRRAELGLSDRPPPGLALSLLSTQAPQSHFAGSASFSVQCHESVQPFNPVVSIATPDLAAADESGNEDDEADDERSHESAEAGQKPPSTFEPPGLGGASGISPLLGTIAGLEQADEATRLWYAQLPSIGSARHWTGACDRCCFHPKGRCLNGYNCEHCHFEHEKRKRKSKKKNKDGELFPESPPSRSQPLSPQDGALKPVGLLPAQAEFHPAQEHKAVHQLLPTDMGYCPQSPHSFGPGSTVGPVPLSSLNAPIGAVGYDPDSRWTAGVDFVNEGAAASVSTTFAAAGAVEPDPRNEYIRQLEAENHHLRMALMSMDPSYTLPPPVCPPPQHMLMPNQQTQTGPASQEVANSSAVMGIATHGQQLTFGPPKPLAQPAATYGTTGLEPSANFGAGQTSEGHGANPESGGSVAQSSGLCASAAPFCPGRFQAWGQPASGDAPIGDASTRLTGFMASPALGGVEEVSLACTHVATPSLGWPAQEAVQGR